LQGFGRKWEKLKKEDTKGRHVFSLVPHPSHSSYFNKANATLRRAQENYNVVLKFLQENDPSKQKEEEEEEIGLEEDEVKEEEITVKKAMRRWQRMLALISDLIKQVAFFLSLLSFFPRAMLGFLHMFEILFSNSKKTNKT